MQLCFFLCGRGCGGGGGEWSLERAFKDDGYKVVSAAGVNADETDDIWVTSDGFTQPTTLSLATASAPQQQEHWGGKVTLSAPGFFMSHSLGAGFGLLHRF